MAPDDPLAAALAAEQARRLNEFSDDIHALQEGNRKLAESHAAQIVEIAALKQRDTDQDEEINRLRDALRANTMVLIGFAFTVAGSAIGLAFALGGGS